MTSKSRIRNKNSEKMKREDSFSIRGKTVSFTKQDFITCPGKPDRMGSFARGDGVQFTLYSRHAKKVYLHFFKHKEDGIPIVSFPLSAEHHRTGDMWHIWIEGVKHGQLYGYSVEGEYNPKQGMRFNKNMLLIDPYARAITDHFRWQEGGAFSYDIHSLHGDLHPNLSKDFPLASKSIVIIDQDGESCPLTRPLNHAPQDCIIYETHLKGFTVDPSSKVKAKGTFKGMVEKIPYLKSLGVTSVELLPVQEFNERENTRINPFTKEPLQNYWGYSTINFFSPKESYAFTDVEGGQVREFRDMVESFHAAGIEIILDVVFNHTAEGNEYGPTLSFRGLDNTIYYILDDDKRYYRNYSGCGNTFNCNHPMVREFILDCLRYWVINMGVDGFRFDLASILGRDQMGNIMASPPLLERISQDGVLSSTKIIAEAWDAGGAYQVGSFPGGRWAEWNGMYRDDVRKFWRGDENMAGKFATRLTGSSDLYGDDGRTPLHSVNFVTCHDGFTLYDLVSYNHKHNEVNGEENRDGENHNYSFNCGVEGETDDEAVLALRRKMVKNFFGTLLVSQGIPMILGGDEFMRTQGGNNNAYCQDNPISWYNWELLEKNKTIARFVRKMIAFRKEHLILRREHFFHKQRAHAHHDPEISWHGVKPFSPCWEPHIKLVAFSLHPSWSDDPDSEKGISIYIAFNAWNGMINLSLPPLEKSKEWFRVVDTSHKSPEDIRSLGDEAPLDEKGRYSLHPQSMIILISKKVREL